MPHFTAALVLYPIAPALSRVFAIEFATNFAVAVCLGRVFSAGPNETVFCAGFATGLLIIPSRPAHVKECGHAFLDPFPTIIARRRGPAARPAGAAARAV